jgi:hypothetical protein
MKKHLNGFRLMSREEQEQTAGGFTQSWFTYDDYGYSSGNTGNTSSTGPSGSSVSPSHTVNTSDADTSVKSKPSTSMVSSTSTKSTDSSTKTTSPTQMISNPSVSTQPTKSPTQTDTKSKTTSNSSDSIQTDSSEKLATSTSNTSISTHSNSASNTPDTHATPRLNPSEKTQQSKTPVSRPEETIPNQNLKSTQSAQANPVKPEISSSTLSKEKNDSPIQIKQTQPKIPQPQTGPTSQSEISGENLGIWLDNRYLGEEAGGFCFAASLLNLYQRQEIPVTQRQVMGIMKEAMNTRSWNDNPVVSHNGFVQEPDTFLAIAARHLSQDALSTGDTKYHGNTLSFAGQTTGLAQQQDTISMSVAQGYLDSFRDHMGYGNTDVAGLVVELRQNNRTHFVSIQGWELSALVDPHGGKDRSDWSIASVRVVT